MSEKITRRTMIQTASAAGAGLLLGTNAAAQQPAEKPLRFVHLTDMHVPLDGNGAAGFAAALRAVGQLDLAPEFMITGGDHIMEGYDVPRGQALAQWTLYRKILAEGTKLRVHPVLGNHDIWAWGASERSLENQPGFGKAMALEHLAIPRPYYSFDAGTWHFIILDSQSRRGQAYFAQLDPAQLEWLRADLAAVPRGRPVCVVSHIPILCACAFFDGDRIRPDHWHVPDAWMHRDTVQLVELFRQHAVKLAISGHIHLHDVVEYNGIQFICDGAVCGNWWKGAYHETPEGFGVFDLYGDGRVVHTYKTFGWKT